jgi:hypothetical protein
VATSLESADRILCDAFMIEGGNVPPTVMRDLEVIRRTTQQGD